MLNEETLPHYLSKFDAFAAENNDYLALPRTTWVDIYFTGALTNINFIALQDVTAKYPNLQKGVKNTVATESIKKWIEKRPTTDDE